MLFEWLELAVAETVDPVSGNHSEMDDQVQNVVAVDPDSISVVLLFIDQQGSSTFRILCNIGSWQRGTCSVTMSVLLEALPGHAVRV